MGWFNHHLELCWLYESRSLVSQDASNHKFGQKYQPPTTLPKFNSEFTPETWWLEDDPASYWVSVTFQGRTVKLQGGSWFWNPQVNLPRKHLFVQVCGYSLTQETYQGDQFGSGNYSLSTWQGADGEAFQCESRFCKSKNGCVSTRWAPKTTSYFSRGP